MQATIHEMAQNENVRASHIHIRTCNVSVVAINDNNNRVGGPTVSSYDVTIFGARARLFESCKSYVMVCFGAC